MDEGRDMMNNVACYVVTIDQSHKSHKCICPISHDTPFKTEMSTFLFWMVHCGIWDRCIVGFVNLVNCWGYIPDSLSWCHEHCGQVPDFQRSCSDLKIGHQGSSPCRNHSGYGLGQWEEALHCNASSHWLSHTQNDPLPSIRCHSDVPHSYELKFNP